MRCSLRAVPARQAAAASSAFLQQHLIKKRKFLTPGASIKEFSAAVGRLTKIQGWSVPILQIGIPDADDDCEVMWLDEDGTVKVNTVNRSEIRVTILKCDYRSQTGRTLEKLHINDVIKTLMIKLQHGAGCKAIVLDHASLTTSRMLTSIDFAPEDIHIPNPDPDVVKGANGLTKTGQIFQQTLFEYLNAFDPETAHGAFHCLFDYCCTFEGGPLCQPTLDLHEMFRKTVLPRQRGVLWLTFSTRGKPGGSEAVAQTVEIWLQAEALYFAYKLTLAYRWSYGTVVTLIYVTGRECTMMDFSYLDLPK